MHLYASLHLRANVLPLFTAFNRFIEVAHALFNIVSEHVFFVDLLTTPLVDLVANLGQQAFHALISGIGV